MAETILALKNIVKAFPGVLALGGITLDLKRGEVHSICGENGAGKSTLMKVICGVYKPDEGSIELEGKPVSFSGPLEAYRQGISIIFQETSLFEEMTVLDNLFLGHEMTRRVGPLALLDYGAMRRKAEGIFKRLRVSIDLDTPIKALGMAQKQMVEIAKALTFDAKIIIFDEPTASLTAREVEALFAIIRELCGQGLGILYISHRLEEVFELCDRVSVIRDGMYISTCATCDTCKDDLVADMVGRKMGDYYPKADTAVGEVLMQVEHYYDEGFLEDISFEVRRGEILGFAGLAGAGRTELMESLCGLAGRAAGTVTLAGKPLAAKSYRQAMEQGIVYVSEDRGKFGIITDLSIEQNIVLPQLDAYANKLGFLNNAGIRALACRYIGDMDIRAPGPDFLAANLSGGNQQKVSVSKALALRPTLMILDEPTRGVDVNAKAEIHKIISALTRQGLTIIMVSSELPELLGMCDRIYVMKDGRIAGCFGRSEATQENILKLALDSGSGKEAEGVKHDEPA